MVKFFCDSCGKEMWQELDEFTKKTHTIFMLETNGIECADCLLKRLGVE